MQKVDDDEDEEENGEANYLPPPIEECSQPGNLCPPPSPPPPPYLPLLTLSSKTWWLQPFKTLTVATTFFCWHIFDHLGPFWAHLDSFGSFQTKLDFVLQSTMAMKHFVFLRQTIDFRLKRFKMLEIVPKWSKMARDKLDWPFGIILDPLKVTEKVLKIAKKGLDIGQKRTLMAGSWHGRYFYTIERG